MTTVHAAVARRRDPNELVALNIGTISGGFSQSVLASEVRLTGTLRTRDEDVRRRLRTVISAVADGMGTQFDTTVELRWSDQMPAVRNDGALVTLARETLARVAEVVTLEVGAMTSDDFALYSALAPTLYLKLGVAPPGHGPSAPLHSGRFDVDESCIHVGVTALTALCLDVLASSTGRS